MDPDPGARKLTKFANKPYSSPRKWLPTFYDLLLTVRYIKYIFHLKIQLLLTEKSDQQGFGSGTVSGSAWIRINLSCWIRIRIRIQIADPDPDPGGHRIQEGKNYPKKDRIFIFWSAGCSLLRAEGFSCSLGALYGGLGISKLLWSRK